RAEVLVRLDRILRHAQHLGAGAPELRQQGVEVQALGGAAGGGILRVEVQHQPLAGVVAERGRLAAGERKGQVGDAVAGVGHRAQYFIGSMMASRFRWSQNSRKSSRSAAMCMSAGTPIVSCAENMSAPVCIAR